MKCCNEHEGLESVKVDFRILIKCSNKHEGLESSDRSYLIYNYR